MSAAAHDHFGGNSADTVMVPLAVIVKRET